MVRLNRIYLVRHGQVIAYDRYPIYGHTDVDMTEVGRSQMERLADRLSLTDIKAIYCSDLKRSLLGAQIICRNHDVPLFPLATLREMSFGDWEGLTLEEVRHRYPEEIKNRQDNLLHFRPSGDSESVATFSKRILSCYNQILTKQKGHDILIVAHGVVNRIILCQALQLDFSCMFRLQQDYGCLNIVDYYADSALVRLLNG
jgi:alpha-ribazole phosphatase/probable phosphoglycerate mutase